MTVVIWVVKVCRLVQTWMVITNIATAIANIAIILCIRGNIATYSSKHGVFFAIIEGTIAITFHRLGAILKHN